MFLAPSLCDLFWSSEPRPECSPGTPTPHHCSRPHPTVMKRLSEIHSLSPAVCRASPSMSRSLQTLHLLNGVAWSPGVKCAAHLCCKAVAERRLLAEGARGGWGLIIKLICPLSKLCNTNQPLTGNVSPPPCPTVGPHSQSSLYESSEYENATVHVIS